MAQCEAILENGQRCSAPSLTDGPTCFFHSGGAAVAGARGGKVGIKRQPLGVELEGTEPQQIADFLRRLINKLAAGHADTTSARCIVYAAQQIIGAYRDSEIGELAKELAELEKRL